MKFEITAARYRFPTAGAALAAASAFAGRTSESYDYDVAYSEGVTEGWAVEVYRAGRRSHHEGNLAPIAEAASDKVLRAYYTSGKKRFHRDFLLSAADVEDASVRAAAISNAMAAAAGREKFVNHVFLSKEQAEFSVRDA